jgi:short-subunit dehydrogenase
MPMDLHGRRVLVTGASRGIGEALARSFATAGAKLALVARSEGPLKALATEVGGVAFPTDLTDGNATAHLIERVESDGGPVDVLINNAGVDLAGPFHRANPADLEDLYRINLLTPLQLCRQVIPGMLDRGFGHIVNISSLAGVGAFPGLTAYSSSKAGLSHFTAGLRADLKGLPVGTTLVEVGPVPTDLLSNVGNYPPTELSFKRFYRLQLLVDRPKELLAEQVVDAVVRNKKHVRLPRRAALFPLLTEAPRRTTELLLSRVPHQD